jgi:hypothetical protein
MREKWKGKGSCLDVRRGKWCSEVEKIEMRRRKIVQPKRG